ncbi:MAG: hypothetical protein JO038_09265 [Alphaproteobacteria bacterium]|nr:hypothetical protein [Alphaproteobacteria bacterium]
MKPKISEDAFAVLVEQAGLPLTDQQRRTLYEAYGMVEAMLARVTEPLPREAEPALIFVPEVR